MTTKTFALPYEFDTRIAGRMIVIGLAAASVLILFAVFVLFPLFVADMTAEDLKLFQMIAIIVSISNIPAAVYLFRTTGGAKGVLNRGLIQAEADAFLGLTSSAPTGTFSPHSFSGIKLTPPEKGFSHVTLIGVAPVGTLKLGYLNTADAGALADMLSENLPLPRLP